MKRFPFAPALAAVACALNASAAQSPQQLPPVDVVATPIVAETTVSGFGHQTTVVGSDQVEALNAADLAAALRRTPGVSIARYNPVGAFGGGEGGAVFLRGLGSSRPGGEIKTTLDGVPVINGVFNHPLLDLLPVELAGRVEVHRRAEPLSAGNMFAGVNLTTPRVTAPGAFGRLGASVGSFGARSGKAEAGFGSAEGELYFGQHYREAEGHRPDAAGRLSNTLVRAAWRPRTTFELNYVAHRSDNRAKDPGPEAGAGLPPTRGDVYTTESWLHLVGATWTRQGGVGSVKAYSNSGDANWLRRTTSANADSLNDYRLTGVRWRESQRVWDGGEWLGGVEVDWTRGTTVSAPPGPAPAIRFGPERFRLASAFTGLSQTWRRVDGAVITPSAGVRAYRHDHFGDTWAPQAGLVLRRGPLQFHAGASRGVNYPGLEVAAFSVVAIPALGQSWRTLRPEKLDQYEAGLRWDVAEETTVELTVFRNEGRDRYVFVPPPPPPFRFLNVERFRTEGGELTVTAKPTRSLVLFGGVSALSVSPVDLPYAPRWSWTGGVTWRVVRNLTLNIDGSYVARQYAASQARAAGAPNLERIGAIALLNVRLGYEVSVAALRHPFELFVAGENLLDREYRYRPGYPMPGAGVTFGLNARF